MIELKPLNGNSKSAEALRYQLENGRLGGYFVIVDDSQHVDLLRAQLTDCEITNGNVMLMAERYYVERQVGYFAHGTFPATEKIIWQSKLNETIFSSYKGIGWELVCGVNSVIIL